MSLDRLIELSINNNIESNKLIDLELTSKTTIKVYPASINTADDIVLFMGKGEDNEKYLFILSNGDEDNSAWDKFSGEELNLNNNGNTIKLKQCRLDHHNAVNISDMFEFARPKVIGLKNSFGFGDRLGLANAGHLQSLEKSSFVPVLAQQSIRELSRTNRKPEEVMDAAVWAVLQEGYKDGFGADADHLKTTNDIDLMVNAGYTMFTFDPSDYVRNDADHLDDKELDERIANLKWDGLNSSYESLKNKYAEKEFKISDDFSIKGGEKELKQALVKYGNALAHIKTLYDHLKNKYPDYESEVEVSVDETESVTAPFEHFFLASELKRLGVDFISLAPRFIGDFEKGIDYKGDLDIFRNEYIKHLKITKYFNSYKISLHSGSDKFGVYKVIGSLNEAYTHVKTAGTSYLEALKVVAVKDPELFRKIFEFSRGLYETEKKTYHVSADISRLKPTDQYDDEELLALFDSNDARQILHVTFGRVLTEVDKNDSYLFKDRILKCLRENEEVHYEFLKKHFERHLEPFSQLKK